MTETEFNPDRADIRADMRAGIRAGAIGGLVAGALVSLAYLGLERASGKPSELIKLGRSTAIAFGSPYRHQDSLPAPDEQVRYQGAHLALSTLMGAAYPLARQLRFYRGALGGALYGASFYALFWGLAGPRLGLTPTPRADGAALAGQKLALLSGFGLVTASIADALSPRTGA